MSNQYANTRSGKNNDLGEIDPAANNIGKAITISGRDLLVGGVAGSATGFFFPRAAFYAGLAATIIGHYKNVPLLKIAGIGMMASGSIRYIVSKATGVNGVNETEQPVDGFKENFEAFKQSWMEKLWLDKLIKPKPLNPAPAATVPPAVNGLDEIQYFTYQPQTITGLDSLAQVEELAIALPVSGMEEPQVLSADPALDFSGLDAIEEQVMNQGVAGLQGTQDSETISDVPGELFGDRAVETLENTDISDKLY